MTVENVLQVMNVSQSPTLHIDAESIHMFLFNSIRPLFSSFI